MINKETFHFVEQHREEDVMQLALKSAPNNVDKIMALQQIEGWQKSRQKIPLWSTTDGILFPVRLSMEQCSSQATAMYKWQVIAKHITNAQNMADLTAGFGVDATILAQHFEHLFYVERNEELCHIAHNNLPLLGVKSHTIIQGDGTKWLAEAPQLDFIFLDPARRSSAGGKVVAIADCEPNVAEWQDALLEKSPLVMIKLSPMLDITAALTLLKHVAEVHIVAVAGECKELLLLLKRNYQGDVKLYCSNDNQQFIFHTNEEQEAPSPSNSEPQSYLYEPNASIMKAGAFKLLSSRFHVNPLGENSHLFTSHQMEEHFPGRVFKIEEWGTMGKDNIKKMLHNVDKANISTRNFPLSAVELRKKLKVKDGGACYLFATTLSDKRKVLLKCSKPSSSMN